MAKYNSVEEYITAQPKWQTSLEKIKTILEATEMEAHIKWNNPVYSLNGKNVLGFGAHKNHFGLWFFNGALLEDKENILVNAQEEKTVALRQIKFESEDEIDEQLIKNYVLEAIENQKQGKVITKRTASKTLELPAIFAKKLSKDAVLKSAFEKFAPYKQKEFIEHIATAKREATQQSRLEKITIMILEGKGLNDKYK
ncbi:YdeI family protein [Zhouia sp. PK063]|uniref:YdeI family protein n=1 Tax=Zhouia sp. PK063 TaxID=3373602 RepID=UPI003795A89F